MFHRQVDQPEVHKITRALRKVIDEYKDRVLIGETDDIAFYGDNDNELQLNFNFPLMRTPAITTSHVRNNQRERLSALPKWAWPCNTFGNHDSSRIYSNYGDGKNNDLQARLYLMLLLTLKGTPFLYNGEEIGMSDYMISVLDLFRDPLSKLFYGWAKSLLGMNEEDAIKVGATRGRDKCRTPMQWNSAANGGFCPKAVNPWLPVNPDFSHGVNVEDQARMDGSLLTFYKNMLRVRKNSKVLQLGDYSTLDNENPAILIFKRNLQKDTVWVLLNMSPILQNANFDLPLEKKNILISTYGSVEVTNSTHCRLQPYQGIIFC